MGDLTFSYLALFIVAGLVGFVAGWFLRALWQKQVLDEVQSDITQLRAAIGQSGALRDNG